MAEYKIYVLGPTGMIARGIWFRSRSDRAAMAEARKRVPGETTEVWAGERRVRTFEPARQTG